VGEGIARFLILAKEDATPCLRLDRDRRAGEARDVSEDLIYLAMNSAKAWPHTP
jgi:hypothetical protein